jgi:opacity protein-like surface antigen
MKNYKFAATVIAALALTAPAQANDTNGTYAGLSFGNMDVSTSGGASASGSGVGVFLGFNGELRGNTVFSGEFEAADIEGLNTYNIKARLGYDIGQRATVFGVAGLGIVSADSFTDSEVIYGMALDVAATSNILVGIEGLKYNVDGGSITTLKARIAYKF